MQTTDELNEIINEIQLANPYNRDLISNKLKHLVPVYGLSATLDILFRQQVNSGFVLIDPADSKGKESKIIPDDMTGIEFKVQWNPARELRKQHQLLIERDIIDSTVDQNQLINLDRNNKPCYLCSNNILLQNPLEVLLPLKLSERAYYCGANFAPITDNHFTLMTSEHVEQKYDSDVLSSMIEFVKQTCGNYKAVFNGRAGASILTHLHLQATTEKFPVESIDRKDDKYLVDRKRITVTKPGYYIPLYIVSGSDFGMVEKYSDRIILSWIEINPAINTQNIIVIKDGDFLTIYIFLRDRKRLVDNGREGDMGTFECAGNLVLSSEVTVMGQSGNERYLYDNVNLDVIRTLLKQIAPDDSNLELSFIVD